MNMSSPTESSSIVGVGPLGFIWTSAQQMKQYDDFMSQYDQTLTRRQNRWEECFLEDGKIDDSISTTRKLKRFIKKGIPDLLRPQIWMATSGANEKRAAHPTLYQELCVKPNQHLDQINLDMPRTFPDNIHFNPKEDNGKVDQLRRILLAYSNYNKEVGYVQGMNYIAGFLLLVVDDEENTFWLLEWTIDKIHSFFTHGMSGVLVDVEVIKDYVKELMPKLYERLESVDICYTFSSNWLLKMYVDELPIDGILRVWDVFYSSGPKVLIQVALGLFSISQAEIIAQKKDEKVMEIVRNLPKNCLDCDALMKVATGFKITSKKLELHRQRVASGARSP